MPILGCGVARLKLASALIVACLALAVEAAPAAAQTQEQIDRCVNKGGQFSPDLSIGGCTAAIQSGRWSGKDLTWAFNNRGNAYRDKKDYDRAIADHSEAIRIEPKNAAAFNKRGNAYHAKQDYDRAIADYSEAIRIEPKFATAFHSRGLAYHAKKDYDRAIADYSEAIRIEPKYAAAFINRGLAYYDKQDYDRAIADHSEAIRIEPKYALAFNNRGAAYRAKQDDDRAIADYSEAIRLDPKDALAFHNRGVAYRFKQDYDRAIADFSEAIRLEPKFAQAFNNRGNAYVAKDDHDRAIADYSKAAELDSKYVQNLGLAKYNKGDFKGAAADLLRAVEAKDDVYAMLLRYLARTRAGEAAADELEANAGRLKTKQWPYAVTELYLGKRTPAATIDAAGKPGDRCEAQYYIGQWYVLQSNTAEAATAFNGAIETCPKDLIEYQAATVEMKRLKP